MARVLSTAIIGAIVVTFCAAWGDFDQAVSTDYPDKPEGVRITLADQRPPNESTYERLSMWATSCDSGVYRLADDATKPSRIVMLQDDLSAALGEKLQNKTVLLKHYAIYFNMHDYLLNSNPATHGLVGAMLMPTGCHASNSRPGSYMMSEVETRNSPYIVEITVSIDGNDFVQRTVYAPWTRPSGLFGSIYEPSSLLEAINRAHRGLILKIRSLLS